MVLVECVSPAKGLVELLVVLARNICMLRIPIDMLGISAVILSLCFPHIMCLLQPWPLQLALQELAEFQCSIAFALTLSRGWRRRMENSF